MSISLLKILKLSLTGLKTNKTRTALSVLGIERGSRLLGAFSGARALMVESKGAKAYERLAKEILGVV